MKTRFKEILRQNCENWGVDYKEVLIGRDSPKPFIKILTVEMYKAEYPFMSTVILARWLNYKDHTSISKLRRSYRDLLNNM